MAALAASGGHRASGIVAQVRNGSGVGAGAGEDTRHLINKGIEPDDMRPTTSDRDGHCLTSPLRGPANPPHNLARGVTNSPGKRRNASFGGQSGSPGSTNGGEEGEGQDEKKKHPAKRACNECRQQKVGSLLCTKVVVSKQIPSDPRALWLTKDTLVTLRRGSRTLYDVHQVPSVETRMQD